MCIKSNLTRSSRHLNGEGKRSLLAYIARPIFFSDIQTYCSCISVNLLSYGSRSTLIRLEHGKNMVGLAVSRGGESALKEREEIEEDDPRLGSGRIAGDGKGNTTSRRYFFL